MISRIGNSFNHSGSFNKYEKQPFQEKEDESKKKKKQYTSDNETPEHFEDVPMLYASTLLNITDPKIENLSPEAKIKFTLSHHNHTDKQTKAINALMTSFTTISDISKKRDISGMICSATKILSSQPSQSVLSEALETLMQEEDEKVYTRAYLGYINLLENNANATRTLKSKAIYLDAVQELNTTQRRVFQSLSTQIKRVYSNTMLLKELIRVIKSSIYLGNETTQLKGLLLVHEIAKAHGSQKTDVRFTGFMLTSMEELKHLMKGKETFKTLKKAFENDIIVISKRLSKY